MTNEQKMQVSTLRDQGLGYGSIANKTGLSVNTVKSFCRRNAKESVEPKVASEPQEHRCRCCGIPVVQNPGRKEKKFCSDKCRNKWWNAHLELVSRRAMREVTCRHCGKKFMVYGSTERKYCSHSCYVAHRFGGGYDE